jgi:hypothetical protein
MSQQVLSQNNRARAENFEELLLYTTSMIVSLTVNRAVMGGDVVLLTRRSKTLSNLAYTLGIVRA